MELAGLGVQGKRVEPHWTNEVNVGRLKILNIFSSELCLSFVDIDCVYHLGVHDLLVNGDPETRVLREHLNHLER